MRMHLWKVFIPAEDFDNCFSEITCIYRLCIVLLCVCVQITTLITAYTYTLILAPIHMHFRLD